MKYLPVAEGIDPNPNKSLHKGFNSVHADYNDIMGKRLDALERVATKENGVQREYKRRFTIYNTGQEPS